ncbi:HD domain-containing protein [Pseudomonas sp. 5P_3.1_Bac2]|uniref:HD domain-containing protein n=1 Tax=Pseudomonas sp. 5P_3.1_Bac2 TaxID=2971617 RepID=UPI0021C68982|nr:HD domain-containing protein [Pseudomonas sp. 5P_3.1_Bac2]MCU1719075.1 HD domain-containing protein [Pseudomonas sp. 5P_3.1_Bac2]
MSKAGFTRIDHSTAEDWQLIMAHDQQYLRELPEHLLRALAKMGEGEQPYQVTRLEHCLQSASRAEQAGADEEMIVAALLHDVGDELALFDHAQFAAAILKPFVTPRTHWIVQHHDIFQGHYYWQHLGLDTDAREQFRGHPWFDACEAFCRDWDCPSFDPAYSSPALEHFAPMLRRIFARPPFSLQETPAP